MNRERLVSARIEALFGLAWPAYFASVALACLLLLVLWDQFPAPLLLGWLGAVVALTAVRVGLQGAYRRAPAARSPPAWEGRFVLGAFGAGALWTFAPAVYLPEAGPLLQLAVVFVVGGTIIGAAGVYAASPAAYYAFSALPLVAVVAQLLAQGGETYPLLAFMVAVFGAAMIPVYRGIHGNVLSALHARIENEDLLGRLAHNESQLQKTVGEAVVKVGELQRAQDAYEQLVAQEKVVFDTLPVGVAFFSERVIVRCNHRLEQMLGYAPGELVGRSSRVLYPSEELWNEAGGRYQLLASGQVLEGEFKLQRKDGSLLWCHSVGRAMNPNAPQASTIVTYSDTSERHAAERALRKSEAMYRNLVETSNDLIWSVDAEGRWTYLSPAAVRRIYGCQPGDLVGREFREIIAPEVGSRDLAVFQRILAGESVFDYQTRHLRRDGSHVDLSFNAVPMRDARGAVIGATGTARDVTAEKIAAAAQYENVEKLRLAVDAAELMYWEWERETDQLHWGRDPSTLVGATGGRNTRWSEYLEIVHPDDRDRYLATVNAAWEQAGACTNEYRVIRSDGRVAWLSSHGKTLADANGRVYRMIGVSQDITERKRQEEEARFLAYHDTLTGLPNRRLLDDRLRQAVFLAQRRDTRVAVMVIDLDEFKQVNDALGHRAGDAVLREASHRIAGCVRKADTLARHGGDEFVVVIPDLHQDGDSQVVAEKILRALEPAFRVDGRDFTIGASIGISLYPTDAGDGEAVLRNADVAMYRAKQLGRNNYRFYGR
ncbi:MAG TPA: PAS domain S-box protein [Burkholderiales bacterium]|nr:PAS domain S-box protein [Burkholderiales bacterium]